VASQSILVVDDEPGIRLYLKRLLGNAGFVVRTAADGNEAVASIEAEPPDLVILDVMVGGRDGYEICEAIKQNPEQAGIKVVMLSAKSRAIEVEKGMALGADAYLTKPFSMDELRDTVRRLLADADAAANGGGSSPGTGRS
jgi:DNA-binding response OmpR family regulator